MTNNENKIDKEKAIELIAGRIDDEFKKHPQLNWQKIAASKIHSQWFEQSQSALEEKDFIIKKKDEIIESQKQTFDSLLKKYEAKDKEIEGLKKECDKYEAQMLKDGSTIQSLKEEVEGLKLKQGCSDPPNCNFNVENLERIKELEEGIKKVIPRLKAHWMAWSAKELESLLSPSKEQKEGEETYCNCNTLKDFDKDWIGKLCPDCNKEIVGPF